MDADGRIYRFAEWYGCQKNLPKVGLRLTDPEIAEGILEREKKLGILGKVHKRLAGEDCFRLKANYKGGGQGPATADEFVAYCKRPDVKKRYGKTVNLSLSKADDTRHTKIRQFRNRLRSPAPNELPMLVTYPQCKAFIRTVQSLVVDDVNPEEIMDHQEDHSYDEAARLCQHMPIGPSDTEVEALIEEKRKKALYDKLDTADRVALDEWNRTLEEAKEMQGEYDWLWR